MTTRQARRAGFTLVEMLVVISIIAILAAISVGAFFLVRGSSEKNAAEATLNKLHSTFDVKYKAVLDDAKKTVPDALVVACGNDKDRALVVWTLAKLKNEFPQTKAEATATYMLPGGKLAPRAVFAAATTINLTPPPGYNPADVAAFNAAAVSSALMHAALTATGGGGTMGGSEGLQQQVGSAPNGVPYFRDSWGMPIGFLRDATNTEIQPPIPPSGAASPNSYFKANRAIVGGTPFYVNTPFDPRARMVDLPANISYRKIYGPLLGMAAANPVEFNNFNRMPTFYSAGPNKEFGTNPVSLTQDESLDNLFSYRLRREGARGE